MRDICDVFCAPTVKTAPQGATATADSTEPPSADAVDGASGTCHALPTQRARKALAPSLPETHTIAAECPAIPVGRAFRPSPGAEVGCDAPCWPRDSGRRYCLDGPGPRADQGDLVVFLACSAHIRVPAGGVVTDDEAELRRRIVTFAAATEQ